VIAKMDATANDVPKPYNVRGYVSHISHDFSTYSSFFTIIVIVAALWNRAGHYIFILWFLLSFLSRLFSAVVHWMCAILLHMVWP